MRKVPELRFKEFSGEWEGKKVKEFGSFLGGGTPSTQILEYWNGEIPWISSSDLFENSITKINLKRFISKESILKSATKLVPKNSILIISRVGVGKVAINSVELCTSQDFINLIPSQNYNYKYLAYLLKLKTKLLLGFNQGTSIKGFVKNDLKELEVKIPFIDEQQKIADFFSLVDKKISLTEEKLENLKNYKKGIMQKIFSQEIRFKDENGEDYPEWEEKCLGSVTKFSKGKGISKKEITNNGIECIRYGELYTTYTEKIEKIYSKTNLLKNELILSEANDVVIPSSGETAIDIATASCVMKDGVALGGDINILKTDMNGLFLAYYINNPAKIEVASLSKGVSVVHLYEKDLKILNIRFPSLLEQQKIANFLASIDDKISNIEKSLEELKTYKKGLLQKMFI